MKKRVLTMLVFIVYWVVIIEVLVFKHLPMIRIGPVRFNLGGTRSGAPNFFPFKTIIPNLMGTHGPVIGGIHLLGNIILLVPAGFIFPFLYQHMTWGRAFVLAVAAGLVLEVTQAIFQVGIFDVDDIILNALGVIIGYGIYTICFRRKPSKPIPPPVG